MLTRRTFIKGALAGLAAGTAGIAWWQSREKPNLVLFIADDLRQGMLACEGNQFIKTPELDKLAHRGTLFKNAFVTTPICPVSRASIFTGNYALKHGVYNFRQPLPKNTKTFLHLLKDAGYTTAFIGKWGIDRTGFEEFDHAHIDDDRSKKHGLHWVNNNGKIWHITDYQTKQAMNFINGNAEKKPFAMVVSYVAPHPPFSPAHRFKELYRGMQLPTYYKGDMDNVPGIAAESVNRQIFKQETVSDTHYQIELRKYYRMITGVDHAVGTVINELRNRDLFDNTAVMFTSDNGMMLGDHGLWGKADGYDASLRVPLIIKPPGIQPPTISEKIALNIDIPATLLAMAGINKPAMQGQNLLRSANARNGFYFEFIKNRPTLVNCEGYRDMAYKYIRYYDGNISEDLMFDIVNDPDEINPLPRAENEQLFSMYKAIMQKEKERLSTS